MEIDSSSESGSDCTPTELEEEAATPMTAVKTCPPKAAPMHLASPAASPPPKAAQTAQQGAEDPAVMLAYMEKKQEMLLAQIAGLKSKVDKMTAEKAYTTPPQKPVFTPDGMCTTAAALPSPAAKAPLPKLPGRLSAPPPKKEPTTPVPKQGAAPQVAQLQVATAAPEPPVPQAAAPQAEPPQVAKAAVQPAAPQAEAPQAAKAALQPAAPQAEPPQVAKAALQRAAPQAEPPQASRPVAKTMESTGVKKGEEEILDAFDLDDKDCLMSQQKK